MFFQPPLQTTRLSLYRVSFPPLGAQVGTAEELLASFPQRLFDWLYAGQSQGGAVEFDRRLDQASQELTYEPFPGPPPECPRP